MKHDVTYLLRRSSHQNPACCQELRAVLHLQGWNPNMHFHASYIFIEWSILQEKIEIARKQICLLYEQKNVNSVGDFECSLIRDCWPILQDGTAPALSSSPYFLLINVPLKLHYIEIWVMSETIQDLNFPFVWFVTVLTNIAAVNRCIKNHHPSWNMPPHQETMYRMDMTT